MSRSLPHIFARARFVAVVCCTPLSLSRSRSLCAHLWLHVAAVTHCGCYHTYTCCRYRFCTLLPPHTATRAAAFAPRTDFAARWWLDLGWLRSLDYTWISLVAFWVLGCILCYVWILITLPHLFYFAAYGFTLHCGLLRCLHMRCRAAHLLPTIVGLHTHHTHTARATRGSSSLVYLWILYTRTRFAFYCTLHRCAVAPFTFVGCVALHVTVYIRCVPSFTHAHTRLRLPFCGYGLRCGLDLRAPGSPFWFDLRCAHYRLRYACLVPRTYLCYTLLHVTCLYSHSRCRYPTFDCRYICHCWCRSFVVVDCCVGTSLVPAPHAGAHTHAPRTRTVTLPLRYAVAHSYVYVAAIAYLCVPVTRLLLWIAATDCAPGCVTRMRLHILLPLRFAVAALPRLRAHALLLRYADLVCGLDFTLPFMDRTRFTARLCIYLRLRLHGCCCRTLLPAVTHTLPVCAHAVTTHTRYPHLLRSPILVVGFRLLLRPSCTVCGCPVYRFILHYTLAVAVIYRCLRIWITRTRCLWLPRVGFCYGCWIVLTFALRWLPATVCCGSRADTAVYTTLPRLHAFAGLRCSYYCRAVPAFRDPRCAVFALPPLPRLRCTHTTRWIAVTISLPTHFTFALYVLPVTGLQLRLRCLLLRWLRALRLLRIALHAGLVSLTLRLYLVYAFDFGYLRISRCYTHATRATVCPARCGAFPRYVGFCVRFVHHAHFPFGCYRRVPRYARTHLVLRTRCILRLRSVPAHAHTRISLAVAVAFTYTFCARV